MARVQHDIGHKRSRRLVNEAFSEMSRMERALARDWYRGRRKEGRTVSEARWSVIGFDIRLVLFPETRFREEHHYT